MISPVRAELPRLDVREGVARGVANIGRLGRRERHDAHRHSRQRVELIPSLRFAAAGRLDVVGDVERRDVDVLSEVALAEQPQRVLVLEVAPGSLSDVFVTDATDDFKRRELHRCRLDRLDVGHHGDAAGFHDPARQREHEMLAELHGVRVGLPPACDGVRCDLVHTRGRRWCYWRGLGDRRRRQPYPGRHHHRDCTDTPQPGSSDHDRFSSLRASQLLGRPGEEGLGTAFKRRSSLE